MKPIFILIFLFLSLFSNSQNLYINEIVSENVDGQQDQFFERDDWIEIYNTGGITNLAGYYLSDDPLIPNKWLIPNTNAGATTVLPNSHIVFWCDRDPEQGEDHTDFSLNIDGETVLLVAPDGVTVIDSITYPQMAADISYGRSCDGCDTWQYFNNVTFENDNGEIIPDPQLVFINEVMANNTSYWGDQSGEYEPWFEIFNPNSSNVNLAGYSVTLSNGAEWTFPSDVPYYTVVLPGEFKLFWADGEVSEAGNHASFVIENVNTTLTLKGNDGSTIDTYNYIATNENQSYGRQTDGAPTSIVFNSPTPGVTNSLIIIPSPTLYINEVLSVNVADATDEAGQTEDWFEIYNPNSFAVNLAGYYISDNPENPRKWQVPFFDAAATTVGANDWIIFWCDEDQTQGITHTSFRLSNNNEALRVTTPDGITLVDQISWQGMDPDTSLGRLTDGSPQWVFFLQTTPDASNNGALVEVEESETNQLIQVFPNPSNGMIYFSKPSDFILMSSTGAFISSGKNANQLDLSPLSNGIYFIKTPIGETFRIVKY
ncbi:MAG: lamin tail domain-containing protein [Flavobacteriales bacterium]|jgi:hypothetical protein